MKAYELTYIISPEITSEEAGAVAREIESSIQGKEGIIIKQENPSAKPLAYVIKKHASGFVGAIEFQSEPENVKELEEKLHKDAKIIRSMVTIKQIQKPRKERGSRRIIAETKQPEIEIEKPSEKEKEKVELKDIEQKLDEILGE